MRDDKVPLDARVEIERLQSLYTKDPRQSKFNALLLGEKGVGKTSLLRSARLPVYLDSFDPNGTLVLKDMIEKGDIVANTQYEVEDPLNPIQYKQWQFNIKNLYDNKFFNNFSTYALDSTTSWGDAILYWVQHTIMKDANGKGVSHAGETPKWNRDYRPVRTQMENCIRFLLNLPCDVILIGHYTGDYEDKYNAISGEKESELIRYVFNGVGETKNKIPLFFSEIWIMQYMRETSKGSERKLLTQPDGLFRASTRLGHGGKFEKWEEPDIKKLLKKAGWPTQDKPHLSTLDKEVETK